MSARPGLKQIVPGPVVVAVAGAGSAPDLIVAVAEVAAEGIRIIGDKG
jgi:DNA-binding MurR/RpiR family transcriptional regulator